MTSVFTSPLAGALMITFFAPASRWPLALTSSVNRPVLSMHVVDAERLPRQILGLARGHHALDLVAVDDERVRLGGVGIALAVSTLCLKRPCTLSYLIW
jgi:hypothetical protein